MLDILDKCDNKAVRKILSNYIGKKVTIKYNLGRNKYETYDVIIKNLYNHLHQEQMFSIMLLDILN